MGELVRMPFDLGNDDPDFRADATELGDVAKIKPEFEKRGV
jgi:hypothetical protein